MSYPPVPPINGFSFTKNVHGDTYPAIDSAKSNHRGRSVFITGGSRGIGLATAISFAKAGASHISLGAPDLHPGFGNLQGDLDIAAKTAGHPPPQVVLLNLDITDRASIDNAAKEVKALGKLDILINNAGYMAVAEPIISSDEEEWWKTWEVNCRGIYWMTKAFLPLLLATDHGLKTVVNLNSIAAHNLRIHASSYGTTKFAMLKFTEFLMVENPGLLAYCVHPGAIMTVLAEAMPKDTHAGLTDTPEVAADTIVFLTQEKREWLAGRYLSCTWDMPELLEREEEIVKGDKLKMRLVV